MVCYQEDVIRTQNTENKNAIYCVDLKTGKQWSKTFEKEVEVEPYSANGDYINAWSDKTYTIFYRDGTQIFKKHVNELGGGIREVTNDGKYALSIRSSFPDTSHFMVFNLKTMKSLRHNYDTIENSDKQYVFYEGGCFVSNSYYLVAVTSNISQTKSIIAFYNINGEYVGHKVYSDIPSTFGDPRITLLHDGSFEVLMDGAYLGNLILPGVNTLQYLKK